MAKCDLASGGLSSSGTARSSTSAGPWAGKRERCAAAIFPSTPRASRDISPAPSLMGSLLFTYRHRTTTQFVRSMGSDRPAKKDEYANIQQRSHRVPLCLTRLMITATREKEEAAYHRITNAFGSPRVRGGRRGMRGGMWNPRSKEQKRASELVTLLNSLHRRAGGEPERPSGSKSTAYLVPGQ